MYVLRPSSFPMRLLELINRPFCGKPSLTPSNRGKETVKHLAAHDARVYLAVRSEAKASAAIEEIRATIPSADIQFLKLDMMDLAGVAALGEGFLRCSPAVIMLWGSLN